MGAEAERDPRRPGRHRERLTLAAVLFALSAGCASGPPSLSYRVRLAARSPLALDVEVTARGLAPKRLHTEEALGLSAAGLPAAGPGDWAVACQSSPCKLRYRYELERAAVASGESVEVALASERGVIAPASTFLAYPEGHDDVAVDLAVELPEGLRFVTAMVPKNGRYRMRVKDVPFLGYVSIGRFETIVLERGASTVEVVLGGDPPKDTTAFRKLIESRLGMLERLYGRVPMERVGIFSVWRPGLGAVRFGRMMPTGGGSIILTVGTDTPDYVLLHDWVTLHEMIHLGVPTLGPRGRFFDEGLATYLEPLLRVGFGDETEDEAFGDFARGMPLGVRHGEDDVAWNGAWGRTYWGGAYFSLRLDLALRERSGGRVSLADSIRMASAEGLDARRWVSIEDYLRRLDALTGIPVAMDLFDRWGRPCDARTTLSMPAPKRPCDDDGAALEATLGALGVGAKGLEPRPPRKALALGPARSATRTP